MAIRDGESPPLFEQEVSKHLESCSDCRLEIDQQSQAIQLLDGRTRRIFAQDVWPEIAATMEATKARPKQPVSVLPFVALSVFLLMHKIIEVLPSVTAGVMIKLAPVAVLVLFFTLIKQNPFKINQNLKLQGDTK
jgi:predicted anti-sigma-YlaC factor YlaD